MRALVRYLFLVYCLIIFHVAYSYDSSGEKYRFDKIDPALIKDADVIVREKNTIVSIKNNSEFSIVDNTAFSILNNKGLYATIIAIEYDSFSDVSQIECSIYNSEGILLREIKQAEIHDVIETEPSSLFSDSRLKIIDINYKIFPFTIRYSYKKKVNGFIIPPLWHVINHSRTSLENASLKIEVDNECKLLFKEFNLSPSVITSGDKSILYSWNVSNLKALPKEDNIPKNMIFYPALYYYLEEFSIDKITGKFTSWNDFGSFYFQLNENNDALNETAKKEIQQLVASNTNTREIVKNLYHWVQTQTRYVSIQKGIGGWKSSDANYVYKNKYGDCKALVNYMKAVLQVAGINSFPVLICSGEKNQYFDSSMPYNYFNHVILVVPNEIDTIWLECTNQKQAFNYLGNFTSDRFGLMIKKNECKLVKTPSYNININKSDLSGIINISENGLSNCKITLEESGELQDEANIVKFNNSETEKLDWLKNRIAISDFNFKTVNFVETDQDTAYSKIEIDLESSGLTGISGSRIFIHPKIIKGLIEIFPSESTRTFPIDLYLEAEENTSLRFHIPQNFIPESPDKEVNINSEFAEYKYKLKYDETTASIVYTDNFILKKKIILPEKYMEWLNFRNKIIDLKNKTIVCKHI